MKVSNRIIGELGEYIAYNYLLSRGFKMLSYGKGMMRSNRGKYKKINLPSLPDVGVGYSRGLFGTNILFKNKIITPNKVIESDIPKEFDYNDDDISKLANICKNRLPCDMYLNDPLSAPCYILSDIFKPSRLENIEPFCSLRYVDNNHVEIKPKGFHLVTQCQKRMTEIGIRRISNRIFKNTPHFIRDNQRISRYIDNYWYDYYHNTLEPIEHNKVKFKELLGLFPNGHPGRFDFIGLHSGTYYAIEVKTNDARLNGWQKIRMGLLKSFGHRCLIVHVYINENQIILGSTGKAFKFDDIIFKAFNFDVSLPTYSDFLNKLDNIYKWDSDPIYVLMNNEH